MSLPTKSQALYQFWSSFGVPAFEENCVPTGADKPTYPYITYELATSNFDNDVPLSASYWIRSTGLAQLDHFEDALAYRLSMNGIVLRCSGGGIWLKRGTPFGRIMREETDNMVKRKIFNLTAEFLTEV